MILFARTEMTAVHDEFAAHQNRLHQMRFMRNDSMTTHKYANMHQNGNKKCWDLFFREMVDKLKPKNKRTIKMNVMTKRAFKNEN